MGPAKVRILGYPALIGLYRSTNRGGNVGTSFAGIPFPSGEQIFAREKDAIQFEPIDLRNR